MKISKPKDRREQPFITRRGLQNCFSHKEVGNNFFDSGKKNVPPMSIYMRPMPIFVLVLPTIGTNFEKVNNF